MATIVTRAGKGEPLTNNEVDGNFNNLNTELATVAESVTTGLGDLTDSINSSEALVTEALASTATLSAGLDNALEIIDDLGGTYAALEGATFSGAVNVPTPVSGDTSNRVATTQFVETKFGRITSDILPLDDVATDIGNTIRRFRNLYVDRGFFGANTIYIGDASLSATTEGGIILPTNTALGSAENVIPTNLASTVLDFSFASTPLHTHKLELAFVARGAVTAGLPVSLLTEGRVASDIQYFTNDTFIGIAQNSAAEDEEVTVVISGFVDNMTGLLPGFEIYLETDGTFSGEASSTSVKIGRAKSETSLFVYTTTTIDTYAQSIKKIEYTDLSIDVAAPGDNASLVYDNTNGTFTFTPVDISSKIEYNDLSVVVAPAGSSSSLNYDNETGIFSFTPVDLSPYATVAYVDSIIDSAPEALNTLNELAAAIADDANFASTITIAIGTKAPIQNPQFTGEASSPTPTAGDNSTKIATTEFVSEAIASLSSLDSPVFTGIPTAPTAALGTNTNQLATTAFVRANSGGVNVDGGSASTFRNTTTIALNGGGA